MQPPTVQHPKDMFADVGVCEYTKQPIRLCFNEFIGLRSGSDDRVRTVNNTTTSAQGGAALPSGVVRESDTAQGPTAEDFATGAAPSPLPVIILIMGAASPGQFWDDRFCSTLALSGPYRVIRFDNRDVGLSTHFDDGNEDQDDITGKGPAPQREEPPHTTMAASHAVPEHESDSRGGASSSVTSFFSNMLGRGRGGAAAATAANGQEAKKHSAHAPDYLRFAYAALNPGKKVIPETYRMEDMAKDVLGLMDALNVRAAHIVGMCVGGVIAQCMAIRAPERVLSMTLFASHTSDTHGVKWPSMMSMLSMIRCAPRASIFAKYKPLIEAASSPAEKARLEKERDAARAHMYAEALTKLIETIAGDKERIGFDRDRTLRQMERAFQRSLYVMGSGRQVVAILNAAPRGDALRRAVTSQPGAASSARFVPTVIIQGTKDPICPPENARELADCIPGSRVMMLEGCGHVIAPMYRQQILKCVKSVVVEGERARTSPSVSPAVRSHL